MENKIKNEIKKARSLIRIAQTTSQPSDDDQSQTQKEKKLREKQKLEQRRNQQQYNQQKQKQKQKQKLEQKRRRQNTRTRIRVRHPSRKEMEQASDKFVQEQSKQIYQRSKETYNNMLESIRRPFGDAEKELGSKKQKQGIAMATAAFTQFFNSLPPQMQKDIRNNKYYGELVNLLDQKHSYYNYNAIGKRIKGIFDFISSYSAKYLPKQLQQYYQHTTNQRPGQFNFDTEIEGLGGWIGQDEKTKRPQMGLNYKVTF